MTRRIYPLEILLLLNAAPYGFTLLELLIVVIILGILAAIAVPNLLNQVGKARETEARTLIAAMNHAQQGYFMEKAVFANNGTLLGIPVSGLKYYFTDNASLFPSPGVTRARSTTQARTSMAVHSYIGGVSYNTTNQTFNTVVCRGVNMTGLGGTGVAQGINNYGVISTGAISCDTTSPTNQTEEIK